MNIVVLDTTFKPIYILDSYESLIWVDRYYEAGDFEIYTPLNLVLLTYLKEGYYLQIEDSPKTMIIEYIRVTSDFDGGSHLIVSGRSLESILNRRVILPKQTITGKWQTIVKNWLTQCIISPDQTSISSSYYKLRTISNFKYVASTDTKVTSITVPEEEIEGTNLYDAIQQKCQDHEIGFQILLDNDNNFVFNLYAGADRSANQSTNKLVLFAKQYDNISSSEFGSDSRSFSNFIILTNNGTDNKKTRYYGNVKAKGLKHREYYTSCDAETNSDMDYYGNLEVYQNGREISVTAETDPNNTQFVYGIDYFLGDIVEVGSELINGQARITEYTINITESGKEYYPTFQFITDYDGGDE